MTEKRTPNPLPELSEHDAELLSAYIDDMLSPIERAELESRLEEDAFLRDELTAMQQTVAWVNQLPQLKAPRNFTISTADVQVKQAPKKILRPNFAWTVAGTAAAVVVLLFGFGYVFLQSSRGGNAPAMESGNIALMSTSAPQNDSAARSDVEEAVALPTGTPPPTLGALANDTNAAAPMVMEMPSDTVEDEAAAEMSQADSNQATLRLATGAMPETQIAESQSGKMAGVQETATALTSLFAATPTMESFAGSDGATGIAASSPTEEGLALGGNEQDLADDKTQETVGSAAMAQSSVEGNSIISESTEEASIAEIAPQSALPNTGGGFDFVRLGKILLGLLIKLIQEFLQ